jgi:alpha-L-arabinofuranosidase
VSGPRFATKSHGELDYLDVCATRGQAGLSIGVVNRHRDRPMGAQFEIAGSSPGSRGRVFTINGPSPEAMNSFETPRVVEISEREHAGFGPGFSFEFPAHSVTLLEIPA